MKNKTFEGSLRPGRGARPKPGPGFEGPLRPGTPPAGYDRCREEPGWRPEPERSSDALTKKELDLMAELIETDIQEPNFDRRTIPTWRRIVKKLRAQSAVLTDLKTCTGAPNVDRLVQQELDRADGL
jgi:hypothetical protein